MRYANSVELADPETASWERRDSPFCRRESQRHHFCLGMNPGTPVSPTALNLTRDVIPSLISRIASSGRVETSKFS
jgi:hypothetical protein